MSLQVEKLEKNMAKLTIEVSADELEKALQNAYKKQKNKISMPGFRKGKVPRQMIEKMYGAEIFYDDAANALIPKAYADAYKDYQAGTDEVKAQLYVKTKNTLIKNIFDDAQSTSPGSGSVAVATKVYIPNNMQSASYFFRKGLYDNSVMVTTSTAATMKLGIKTGTSNNGSWTMFDNFRLFSYGNMTQEEILPVKSVSADPERGNADTKIYDLSGRRVSTPGSRGIFIVNGKKVVF